MRFGLHLTHYRPKGAHDPSIEFAQQAEEIGFSSVWAGDHIVNPEYVNTVYPHAAAGSVRTVQAPGGMPDPFVLLAMIGARTTRIRLGFDVLIAPYRPPLLTAKQIATLDHFTGGRVIAGIGVGWHEQEFAALGVPFRERGIRTDETVAIWRLAWQGENFSFRGRCFSFDSLFVLPKPANPAGVPIWIGGDGKRARERVARYGDGWLPTFNDPARFREQQTEIVRLAASLGRPAPTAAVQQRIAFTERPHQPTDEDLANRYRPITGTPDQVLARLKAYEVVGVEEFLITRTQEDPAELGRILARFQREILPAFGSISG